MAATPVASFSVVVLDVVDLSRRLERILLNRSRSSSFTPINYPIPNLRSEDTPIRSRLHTHWRVGRDSPLSLEPLGHPFYPTFAFILDGLEQNKLGLATHQQPREIGTVLERKRPHVDDGNMSDSEKTIRWNANPPYTPCWRFENLSVIPSSRASSPTDFAPYFSDGSARAHSPTPSDPCSDEDDGGYFYPPHSPLHIHSTSLPLAYDWDAVADGDSYPPLDNLKMYRQQMAIETNGMRQHDNTEMVSSDFEGSLVSPWAWQWEKRELWFEISGVAITPATT